MPNSEVIINNEIIMSTVNDSVTPDTLAEGQTATNSAGEKIKGALKVYEIDGELDPNSENPIQNKVVCNSAYIINDTISDDIEEDDYIPFNDISDDDKPKKKISINNLKSKFETNICNGYAVGSVSDNAISANITGFKLKNGVIVSILATMPVNATLNINNTGAKPVLWNNNSGIKAGDNVANNLQVYTVMYDGVSYRIIACNKVALIIPQNYVSNTSGNIIIQAGFDQNIYQLKYNLNVDKLKWNFFKNNVWHGDTTIADYNDLITQLGNSIPSSSNLNNYNSVGIYKVDSDAIAGSITNIPIARSGKLVVMALTATNAYNCQLYITNSEDHFYMRRQSSIGTWSAWVDLATANWKTFTGVCSTVEANIAKEVTVDSDFVLAKGVTLAIMFTYNVPASATLSVNSSPSKSIYYRGSAVTNGIIKEGDTVQLVYDGLSFNVLSII